MSCFRQTCDQTITGRSFGYGRALEVVQTEDYLNDIDFDFIRRRSDLQSELFDHNALSGSVRKKRASTYCQQHPYDPQCIVTPPEVSEPSVQPMNDAGTYFIVSQFTIFL